MEQHRVNFKLLILRKLWRKLKMFLSSFSEMVNEFWRIVGNTLFKFLDILKKNFVTFLYQFLEKIVKNYPRNMQLVWENFEIICRNYKIIILGTLWKFLKKYVHQVSFGKQILNYLQETLKKCWKFGEKFWGISDQLCRSILNIFMKSGKNFKKLLKNYGVNFKLILGKLWGNIRVIL